MTGQQLDAALKRGSRKIMWDMPLEYWCGFCQTLYATTSSSQASAAELDTVKALLRAHRLERRCDKN